VLNGVELKGPPHAAPRDSRSVRDAPSPARHAPGWLRILARPVSQLLPGAGPAPRARAQRPLAPDGLCWVASGLPGAPPSAPCEPRARCWPLGSCSARPIVMGDDTAMVLRREALAEAMDRQPVGQVVWPSRAATAARRPATCGAAAQVCRKVKLVTSGRWRRCGDWAFPYLARTAPLLIAPLARQSAGSASPVTLLPHGLQGRALGAGCWQAGWAPGGSLVPWLCWPADGGHSGDSMGPA